MFEIVAALDPCQWNGTTLVFKIWVYVLLHAVDEAIRNGTGRLFCLDNHVSVPCAMMLLVRRYC